MRKIVLGLLSIMLATSTGAALASCGNDSDKTSSSASKVEIVVPEEITVPVGTKYVPQINVNIEGVKFTVKVTDPDGSEVALGEDNSFTITKFGEYKLVVLLDGNEMASSIINAVDGTAPIIKSTIKDKDNVELGVYDKFADDIKTLEAEDDVDGKEVTKAVEKYRFADEKIKTIENNSIKIDKVGVYTIYGYVMDNSGNRNEFSYKLNSVDTIKPELNCKDVYYVWTDETGKASLPEVEYTDNGNVTIEAVVKASDGTTVEVKDGKFNAKAGKYEVDFLANDGYNVSDVKKSIIRVLNKGTVCDFLDEIDTNSWTGAEYKNGAMAVVGETAGEVKFNVPIENWSDYGYLVLNLKNNKDSELALNLTFSNGSENVDYGNLRIPANYNGEVEVFFREIEINASKLSAITMKVEDVHDFEIKGIELKNLPEEIFGLNNYEASIKTFEGFEAPDFKYIKEFEKFVKDDGIEVVGTKDYVIENGKYVFEKEGKFEIVYKASTKTGQIFEKKIKVTVVKGEPVIVIKDLPLGVIGKPAYISRFDVHNVETADIRSVKATCKAPNGKEFEIEGDIDGFEFTPDQIGIYTVTITAETKDGILTEVKEMYVKPLTEIVSYENNNGVVEGSTSQNDWLGFGEFTFNTNKDYVYSGLQSAKYVIPAGKNSGTTYFLDNILKSNDPNADVIQFALTSEIDSTICIYLHCDSTEGKQYYGYSEYIYLKAGEWTLFTAPLSSFDYQGTALGIPNGKFAGITGMEFNNKGGDTTIYVDQISVFNHKDLVEINIGEDIETKTFQMIDVPNVTKLYPQKCYGNYQVKLYNENTKEEVDIANKKQFYFTKTGTYLFEVSYNIFGEEKKIVKKYTVNEATDASLMVAENKLDMMVGTEYILPEYSANIPSTIKDAVITITANMGNHIINVDIDTRVFTPDQAGDWTITYKLAYGDKEQTYVIEKFIREADSLFTFEETPDGIIKGIDEGDGNRGVSINKDSKYVISGKQSLKITYPAASYGSTTAFGSDSAFWLNHGFMKNDYSPIGYMEGKSTGANAIIFQLYAEKDGQIILDLPGSAVTWNYNYSKIYNIKAGWNEIRFDNSCKLKGTDPDVNLTEGIYKFFIGSYFADGQPTEDTVFYIDDVKLIFDESAYELKPGEFLTFENIDGSIQGMENISSGSDGVSYEVSSDWASQGNNSLKVTFDNAKLQETNLAGAKKRLVLFNSKWGGHIGVPDAHVGMNALQLTVNPLSDMDILFDIEYHEGESNSWAYTRVYHLKANQINTITISSYDTIQGGPILFDNGLFMFNINYLDYNITNVDEKEVLYVDGFKFVNVPAYERKPGEIASFERGKTGYTGYDQFKSITAATHELTDEWSSDGENSVKVLFDKVKFAQNANLLGHTWNRGVICLGDYGKPGFPKDAYNEVENGTNALALTIKASEDMKVIFEIYYEGASNGWGTYTRIYELKKGVNEVIIGVADANGGTLDLTKGITQFNVNYVVEPTETTGTTTVYFDNLRYYRQKAIVSKANLMDFENDKGDYNGHALIKKGGEPKNLTYSPSTDWKNEGESSLKVVIERQNISAGDTTNIGGGGLWSILRLGGWGTDSLPARTDLAEMNGLHMVINSTYRQSIVFEMYDRSDAWMYVNVILQPGVNDIVITAKDKAAGNVGTFDFTKGMSRMFINFVTNAEDVMEIQTMYIDSIEYVNIR